ncbi:succinyl-CoA transferase Rv0802c [Microbacterium nanhaiense]|uniref:Succinyl-CoA transferase Rv0802c n=1 Tax=Microbacterium nanhaiense TaxID=1301026 RepID=A0ABQ2N3S9_9MICO|nr:GNAT family protein [Microbacterium nanhaiense]GGO61972.1 succinyl-CoA transferase Rv0802c [Microbacterium nanhaiense]
MDLEDIWPLFGLTITTPRLTLSPVRDADLPGLVRAALDGVHDPEQMPFGFPWTDAPASDLPGNLAIYQWGLRGRVSPSSWNIAFAAHYEGRVIGTQDLSAYDFANRQTVNSGSWITRSVQGRGLGTEMRAGLLAFAFDVLGAEWAESSATSTNAASLAVSRKLGYELNGVTRQSPRPGQPVDEQRVRLPRADFLRPNWSPQIVCSDAVLRQLGAAHGLIAASTDTIAA